MGVSDSVRRLPNWIESFIRYSEVLQSPTIFRQWAALSLISMVTERKVWARTKGTNLYPNLYIILTAPPGIGKSNILSTSERILRLIPNIHVAPSSLTTASMIDTILLSKRQLHEPGPMFAEEFNSLQVVASELGVFLPAYDPAFMNTLTKLYDGEHYEERRRTGKVNHIKIEKPLLSILGGTTPSYLSSFLPEGGWDQGFTSRTIFVFDDVYKLIPIFEEKDETEYVAQLFNDLIHDLKIISKMTGKMNWTQQAMDAISAWDQDNLKPIPKHGKLLHYNSRRLAHAIKLCVVASVSRSSNMEIGLADFFTARSWLLEAESQMDGIFTSMAKGGDSSVINDCKDFVAKIYARQGHPVSEHLVVAFLRDRVPTSSISKIIEMMIRAHDLKMVLVNALPCYRPLP